MRRTTLLCLMLLVFLAPCAGRAWAQGRVADLNDLTAKAEVSEADKDKIQKYIAQFVDQLGGDQIEVKRAREQLLSPFNGSGGPVSLSFRLAYGSFLREKLATLAESTDDLFAANALRIAGELASPWSVDLLLKGLKDKRSSVRYAAAFGAARLFDALGTGDPAITSARLDALIKALGEAYKIEADPLVQEGIVLALHAAIKLPGTQIKDADFHARAIVALVSNVSARLKVLAKEEKPTLVLPSVIRVLVVMRDVVINDKAVPAQAKDATRQCGVDAQATVAELRKLPNLTAEDRTLLDKVQAAAKTLLDLLEGK